MGFFFIFFWYLYWHNIIFILKYQKLYKQGKIKEAIPHLLIISDEFAELKKDRPEFMEKLISTIKANFSNFSIWFDISTYFGFYNLTV